MAALATIACGAGGAWAESETAGGPPAEPAPMSEDEFDDGLVPFLDVMIVTAKRKESLLQETPIAITALGLDAIQRRNIQSIADVSALAPNSIVQQQPASNANASIVIRGVGSGDLSLMIDPKISYYIDGVYMSKTVGAVFDLVDVQRIEVLRGPQGTLFGRNSAGGALNISTIQPSGEFGTRLQATYGSHGHSRHMASVDLPSIDDRFAVRLSGLLSKYGGWAENNCWEDDGCRQLAMSNGFDQDTLVADLDTENNKAFRISSIFDVTPTFSLSYAYDLTANQGAPPPFQVVGIHGAGDDLNGRGRDADEAMGVDFVAAGGGPSGLYGMLDANLHDPNKRQTKFNLDHQTKETLDVSGHSLSAAWDAPFATFKYIFAKRGTSQSYGGADLDGGAYRRPDTALSMPGFHSQLPLSDIDMTTHELQMFGVALDGRMDYTLGYYRYNEEVAQNNPQRLSVPAQTIWNNVIGQAAQAGFADAAAFLQPIICGSATSCIGTFLVPYDPTAEIESLGINLNPDFRPNENDAGSPPINDNPQNYIGFEYGQKAKADALYAQATYEMTDALDVTAGLRWTKDSKRGHLFNESICYAENPLAAVPSGLAPLLGLGESAIPDAVAARAKCLAGSDFSNGINHSQSWDNLSYLLTAAYQLSPEKQMYLTRSTGYNAGGYNARAGTTIGFQTPVDEETIGNWELGFKGEWIDRRLRTNVSVFASTFKDMQLTQFDASASGASLNLINAGTAKFWGVELDAALALDYGWDVDFTYGLLNSKFTKYCVNPIGDETPSGKCGEDGKINIAGNVSMPLAPKHTANVGAQWTPERMSFGAPILRFDAVYTAKFQFHPFLTQYDTAKGRWLLNAQVGVREIGVRDGNLQVTAWVRNLTNKTYRDWGIDFGQLGYAGAVHGRPRSFGVDLIYSFDSN